MTPAAALLAARDRALVQIVDAALDEATRRAGPWLVCRPGCAECCMGPFAITQLDALRLRQGMAALEESDPECAARVQARTHRYLELIAPEYPDDMRSVEEEPCPALDPATGRCDLYAARPVTCRTFGPPARIEGGSLAVCELCFDGATSDQIAACAVDFDPDGLEAALLAELDAAGKRGSSMVAFALAGA